MVISQVPLRPDVLVSRFQYPSVTCLWKDFSGILAGLSWWDVPWNLGVRGLTSFFLGATAHVLEAKYCNPSPAACCSLSRTRFHKA